MADRTAFAVSHLQHRVRKLRRRAIVACILCALGGCGLGLIVADEVLPVCGDAGVARGR